MPKLSLMKNPNTGMFWLPEPENFIKMKPTRVFLLILALFFLNSCKNEEPGIEERNEVPEITSLTNSENIKKTAGDLDLDPATLAYYENHDFQPIWNDRELREDLFSQIENIDGDGLSPEDYHYTALQEILSQLQDASSEKRTEAEILLTEAFLKLSDHLYSGKTDPRKLHEIWGTPLNAVNTDSLLQVAIDENEVREILEKLRPKTEHYTGLKRKLRDVKSDSSKSSVEKIAFEKMVRPGENSLIIPSVTRKLQELKYLEKTSDSSLYDHTIQQAIKSFQKDHALEVDGIIGAGTVSELNKTKEERIRQIEVNLERWRWYPRDLGDHYILINIADFELTRVRNGEVEDSRKVMVGTQSRKTPVFSDKIKYVVLNPTWTIPPTIRKRDVIPGMRKNSNYLKSKNIDVYSGGQKLDPASINWNSSEPYNYTYRQESGPTNPLGIVKIIYPNEYLIYLHDTPSKNLFSKNSRAQSSGCVRVEGALELAKFLLDDQPEYTSEAIDEMLESGETMELAVKKDVKVHHFYWTAFTRNDNLYFRNDIYDLDQKIWKALNAE